MSHTTFYSTRFFVCKNAIDIFSRLLLHFSAPFTPIMFSSVYELTPSQSCIYFFFVFFLHNYKQRKRFQFRSSVCVSVSVCMLACIQLEIYLCEWTCAAAATVAPNTIKLSHIRKERHKHTPHSNKHGHTYTLNLARAHTNSVVGANEGKRGKELRVEWR